MAPDGRPIEEKDCTRDLGVQISSNLTFKAQIKKTVAAGTKMAGWALRGRWKVLVSLIQPRTSVVTQVLHPVHCRW